MTKYKVTAIRQDGTRESYGWTGDYNKVMHRTSQLVSYDSIRSVFFWTKEKNECVKIDIMKSK